MRREHDFLINQNEALQRQNRALIDVVTQFDGRIEEGNRIIRELLPYKSMYEQAL